MEAEFNFFRRRRTNPLDDTVVYVEQELPLPEEGQNPEPTVKAYIDDFNIVKVMSKATKRRSYTTNRAQIKIIQENWGRILEAISTKAEELKMRVNTKKTQMFCISQNNNAEITTVIRPNGDVVESCDELKILGFVFNSKPSCKAQIQYLLGKFCSQLWSLRKMAAG